MLHRWIERADAAASAVGRSLLHWGAVAAAVIAGATLVAWVVGPEALVRVRDTWPVTTPITAVGLLSCALAVELRRRGETRWTRVAQVIGAAVALLGGVVVAARLGYLPGAMLPTPPFPNLTAWQPGVVAPALPPLLTGLILVALGQTIAVGPRADTRLRVASRLVGVASWVAIGTVLLGYLGAETGGLRWSQPPAVSLPAAAGFALVWIPLGQLTVGADLVARFGSSATARLLLKRVGPMLALVPLLLRGVGRLAETLHADPATAAALADIAVMFLLGGALLAVGRAVDRSHAERARSTALLQGVLGALHEGLIVRDADGHIVVANPAADELLNLRFADDPDRATMIAVGGLRDEGGMPLAVEDLPSSEVARTGAPVIGRVLQLGDDPEHPTWVRSSSVPFVDADGRIGTVSTISDITFDHEMSLALSLAEERFRLAFEDAPIGIAIVRPDGTFEDANPALCSVLERTRDEVLDLSLPALVHPGDPGLDEQALAELAAGHADSYRADQRYLRPGGSVVWLSLHVSALRDQAGETDRFLVQAVDLTDRKLLEIQLAHAAAHDPLTGLPNRRLVEDRLTVALATARRERRQVAVMFCDLDGFKAINDVHGHAVGDLVLHEVSERLQRVGRGVDTVGRIGGDEFVVIAGGMTDPEDAHRMADRLRDAVEQPIALDGLELVPRVSVGLFLTDGHTPADEALRRADARMYETKSARRVPGSR